MSMYDRETESAMAAPAAAPETNADGEIIVPDYDEKLQTGGDSSASGGNFIPGAAAAGAVAAVDTRCFGIQRAAFPLIFAHFIHYNAWAVANVPYNYVINTVACPAHTESACAESLAWLSALNFSNR